MHQQVHWQKSGRGFASGPWPRFSATIPPAGITRSLSLSGLKLLLLFCLLVANRNRECNLLFRSQSSTRLLLAPFFFAIYGVNDTCCDDVSVLLFGVRASVFAVRLLFRRRGSCYLRCTCKVWFFNW